MVPPVARRTTLGFILNFASNFHIQRRDAEERRGRRENQTHCSQQRGSDTVPILGFAFSAVSARLCVSALDFAVRRPQPAPTSPPATHRPPPPDPPASHSRSRYG